MKGGEWSIRRILVRVVLYVVCLVLMGVSAYIPFALPTLTSFVVAILVWFLCVLNFYADLRMIADARKLERIRAPNDPSERST